jgi:hypothetical protein
MLNVHEANEPTELIQLIYSEVLLYVEITDSHHPSALLRFHLIKSFFINIFAKY